MPSKNHEIDPYNQGSLLPETIGGVAVQAAEGSYFPDQSAAAPGYPEAPPLSEEARQIVRLSAEQKTLDMFARECKSLNNISNLSRIKAAKEDDGEDMKVLKSLGRRIAGSERSRDELRLAAKVSYAGALGIEADIQTDSAGNKAVKTADPSQQDALNGAFRDFREQYAEPRNSTIRDARRKVLGRELKRLHQELQS